MVPKSPKPEEPEIVRTTIRVPQPLWDTVQHRAIDERTSAQEIVNRALENYLKTAKIRKGGK